MPFTKSAPMVPLLSARHISWITCPNSKHFHRIIPLDTKSTKVAQMVPLRWTEGQPELQIRNIFKRHLLLDHGAKFKIISQNCSSWCLLSKLHKWFCFTKQMAARTLDKKCHLMTFPPEPLDQIHNNCSSWWLLPNLHKHFR